MDATEHASPNRFRLVAAIVYAVVAVIVLALTLSRPVPLAPAALIALSVPLALRLVPRNRLYGLRTPRTMRGTEEAWYRQNVIAGIVGTSIGVVWLVIAATTSSLFSK